LNFFFPCSFSKEMGEKGKRRGRISKFQSGHEKVFKELGWWDARIGQGKQRRKWGSLLH